MKFLHKLAHSPYLALISGLVLLTSGTAEILRTLEEATLGAHHGVAFAGLVQIIQVIPHLVHGAKELEEAGGDGEGEAGVH